MSHCCVATPTISNPSSHSSVSVARCPCGGREPLTHFPLSMSGSGQSTPAHRRHQTRGTKRTFKRKRALTDACGWSRLEVPIGRTCPCPGSVQRVAFFACVLYDCSVVVQFSFWRKISITNDTGRQTFDHCEVQRHVICQRPPHTNQESRDPHLRTRVDDPSIPYLHRRARCDPPACTYDHKHLVHAFMSHTNHLRQPSTHPTLHVITIFAPNSVPSE